MTKNNKNKIMKNKSLLILSLLMLTSLFASAQLSELSGYKISVSSAEATDFTTGQWYVIKSRGRAAYAYENSSNAMFMKSGNADGEAATASCGSLIRFVSAGSGKYYIQTGYGHYLKSGNANGAILAVVNTSAAGTFTVGKINSTDAHFYMQDASTNFVVDANPAGSSMAYWGTTVPTNAAGTQNNDWALYAVTLNMDQAAWFSDQIGSGKAFRLQCRLGYTGSPTYQYAAVNASGENVVATKATSGDDAYRQIWIIEPSGTGFTLRNVFTGLYITSSVSGSGSATPGTFYGKRSDSNVDSSTAYVTLSTSSVFSGSSCLHHQESGHRLVAYYAGTESGNYASDWVLEPVEDITTAEIKEKLNAALGYSLPTSGKTYRVYNTAYNLTAAELTSGHTTLCGQHAVTDYTALWNVTVSGGQITLQNAITDRYIQKQNGAVSTVYTTGESAASFTLADASNWVYTYTLADAGGIGLHCASSQNNKIVGWYTDAAASVWRFEEVTPDASILAASRDTYQEHLDMKENASTYSTALQTFFTDGTCTQLRSPYATYSDANLRSAMTSAGLPSALVTMALKVKNNTWTTYSGWDKTEKTFRVAEYQPYSDYQRWTSILGQGYYVGRLANPTGVSASNGELVYVYVGSIPSGQTVALEAVSLGAASGPQTTLTEGLNVVEIDGDANLFIYNSVDNTTSGGAPFTALSSYSPVSVHIEGGYVNGYFDLRRGDTDTDWEQLNAHLLSADAVDIRSLNYCMHLSKSETVAAVNEGGTLTGLLEIWDNILSAQRELQGLEDYDGYFNNPLSFTSPGSTGAHASNHGVFVATNQLSFLMNYNSMNTETNALWEAAHETGHIHQNPINMIGCMEISNNVFSNVSIYQQGRYTSRSRSIQDTFSEFADGISWLDRIFDSSASSEQADLWQGTHLYWQLYQFFHLAGYDTDFYPQLYKTFRADRMNHANNTFVPASEDYLKFYKTCCSVSGYDLTEFFQVYGFFTIPTQTSYTLSGTTRDAHLVGDYANYYVYTTQEMIDAVKAEVAAMNLPKANIIFIEDRITAPDATYAGAPAGTKKTSYATGWSNCGEIGNCGEMGQYTSFATPISGSYEYTVDSEGNVTVSGGSGAVGIKVYDGSGNLAFVANTSTFTLPSSLVGGTYTIKAAGGNGSDVTILKAGETPVTYPFSFSTEESPVYYYIKFKAGEAVLADKGMGNNVLTEAYEQNSEAQKWAFIGTADNFVLKSKSGGYLNYASSRYNTSATGTPMTIVTSGTGYFEMRRTAGSQYLNQYGGYGIGKQLGEWTQADANNIFSVEEVGNIDTSLPIFTTPDSPKYYYAKFYTGGNVLADQGSGSNLLTESMVDADADQLWAFYGTRENFVMCSKTGNYVNFASSRYTADASGVALALKATGNASATGCWEIKRVAGSNYMNQFGGTGVGVQLGEWTYGDNNNPIRFVATEAELPEFSTGTNEHWYFIQFCNGLQTLRAATAGGNVTYVTLNYEAEQQWKLVGSQSNFQLVSKTGLYAAINGTGNNARLKSQTTPDTNGFSLVATTNSTYKPNWEIRWNGTNNGKERLNRWGGGELSVSEIGMWSANDSNNPFYFVDPNSLDFPEFNIVGATSYAPVSGQSLWYTQPSTTTGVSNEWMEYSLPIGNGQLGASLFGGVKKDQVLFNEKTVWSGSTALSSGGGSGYGNYQYFGSFFAEEITDGRFSYSSTRPVSNYVRQLDLSTAVASVQYSDADGVDYTRQYIASRPDEAIIARYSASESGKINLRFTLVPGALRLANGTNLTPAVSYINGEATFQQKLDLVTANARLKVIPTGGTMTTNNSNIEVVGADEVLVVFCGGTDFDLNSSTYISNTSSLASNIQSKVNAAAAKDWVMLLSNHVLDYQILFNRVNFTLEGATNDIPTNQLVDTYSNTAANSSTGNTKMLEKLYFDYGRYLEISSSRGVDVPSNLQGIWNATPTPPWNSDIHANINVQMNYWPAEPTNLSETHLPFLNYIIALADNSKHTEWTSRATRSGQTVGWTFYTENNIFGGGSPWSDNYTIANAWYATHLWQHYRYTLDRTFLLRAFPAMWSCSQYWMERMVRATDGTYECPNEYSPEHGPSSENATAHSQQLVVELFQNTMAAAEVLGSEAGLTTAELAQLQDYITNSDKGLATETYTGTWGNPQNGVSSGTEILREWKYSSYSVGENNHRHQSHLMCLYPYAQVTPDSPYFEAAVNSLKLRSDNSTGWSMGWRINLWARAQDGDHAHVLLHSALRHSTSYGTDQSRGGIYYNLYDSHAPFQIDGNFGACAGIAEMLMQSADGTISILPALPTVWDEGSITGLKAVGNFTVGVAWENGAATTASITSNAGQPLVVKYPGIANAAVTIGGVDATVVPNGTDEISITLAQGETAEINFNPEKISLTWIVTNENDVEVYRSAATIHTKGTTVTTLPDELLAFKSRFVSYPSETSLNIAADETKDVRIAYQWDGPFRFSSTERYYYALKFDYYSAPYVQAGSASPYALTQTRSGDAYRWYFEGNPFSGIILRNKFDTSLGLQATDMNTNGTAGPTLTTTPTAFEIYNWNADGTNNGYFALRVPTTSDYYLNNYSGGAQMKYWSSGPGDLGSRLSVEACLETSDGYYRLYNKVNTTHWLNITENGYKVNTLVGSTQAEAEAAALADPSTVFRFQEQSDGSYLISSRGAYLTTQTSYSQPVVVSENASEAFNCKLARNNDGTWSIQVGSGAYNYLDNNENYKNYDAASGIVTWEKADENSHWYMVPAESYKVSLNKPSGSDKTFATVYLPFGYTMPAAATANVINVNQQTKMAETHALAGIVPAGTPALFISDEGATQVELTITTGDLESDTETLCEGNELAGNYVETDTPAGTYTFQAPKGVPGFYKYTGAKLKAYRAFLPGDVATQTKGFIISFGDATTGISDVTTSGTDERVFDLQGRRVARPTRGIYIIGGKKVLR